MEAKWEGKKYPNPYKRVFDHWFEKANKKDAKYVVASILLPKDFSRLHEKWSRVEYFAEKTGSHHEVAARNIVLCGLKDKDEDKDGCPSWAPASETKLPYRTFGEIKTVDRWEIDTFSQIQSIMAKYRGENQWKTPLSIAVFGQPGSGKSYATRQILKSVDRKESTQRIELNVGQFASLNDLVVAFHRVQDLALKQDTPLVVFDEFDSACNNLALGWLQYFLSPMQDGMFRGGESEYKIGRAIFVFSGGIAHSFYEFYEKKKDEKEFQRAKGPDFVSRLHGHLDIAGIDSNGKVPPLLMCRRAILLRALIEKNPEWATLFYRGEQRHLPEVHDLREYKWIFVRYSHHALAKAVRLGRTC